MSITNSHSHHQTRTYPSNRVRFRLRGVCIGNGVFLLLLVLLLYKQMNLYCFGVLLSICLHGCYVVTRLPNCLLSHYPTIVSPLVVCPNWNPTIFGWMKNSSERRLALFHTTECVNGTHHTLITMAGKPSNDGMRSTLKQVVISVNIRCWGIPSCMVRAVIKMMIVS